MLTLQWGWAGKSCPSHSPAAKLHPSDQPSHPNTYAGPLAEGFHCHHITFLLHQSLMAVRDQALSADCLRSVSCLRNHWFQGFAEMPRSAGICIICSQPRQPALITPHQYLTSSSPHFISHFTSPAVLWSAFLAHLSLTPWLLVTTLMSCPRGIKNSSPWASLSPPPKLSLRWFLLISTAEPREPLQEGKSGRAAVPSCRRSTAQTHSPRSSSDKEQPKPNSPPDLPLWTGSPGCWPFPPLLSPHPIAPTSQRL